jgi:hypothetical protein
MKEIDHLKELEQHSEKLQHIKVNEENHQQVLDDVKHLLSSIEDKLSIILQTLTH